MPDDNDDVPPKPEPEDFGISELTYSAYSDPLHEDHDDALEKVAKYTSAVAEWEQ